MEFLFADANLSKVVDDKQSWFMRIEVLDLFYHQFFFAVNSLGRQPKTCQYFEPLAPQPLALVAKATHCVLSDYGSGKKAAGMFSEDEFWGTFCPSPMMKFTPEATALGNHPFVCRFEPPPPLSPQHVAQLRYDKCSSIPVGTPQPRFTLFYILPQSIPPLSVLLHLDRDSSIPSVLISSPRFVSVLHTPISAVLRAGYNLLDSHWHSLVRIFAPILESALVTHPPPFPCCAVGNALLNPHQSSSA